MKAFAIGISKDWVEVRLAEAPPEERSSVASKKIPSREGKLVDDVFMVVDVINELKIKTVVHIGGEVIGAMPVRKFYRTANLWVGKNKMVEIPLITAKRLFMKGSIKRKKVKRVRE